jgi:very-short-patch-repair endonuclease
LLSKGKMQGYVFNRQKPLGPFIFDFYCKELQLVIEVDGYSHEALEKTVENDRLKDAFVIQSGLTMMRFTNRDVQEEIEEVKSKIEGFITDFEGW